jgi:hypothetical protein
MDTSLLKERALTENVSSRGIRVATEHEWKPGDPVLLISMQDDLCCQARVVYCKPLEKGYLMASEARDPLGQICCRTRTFHAGGAVGKATLAAKE